eukprot:XP_011661472.1 PREDICTED: uncharacterized protein LOC105437025 [Strongylocentrotus purpuratus]
MEQGTTFFNTAPSTMGSMLSQKFNRTEAQFTISIPAFPASFTPDSPPAFLPFPPHSHQIHHQHSCLSRRIHTRFTISIPAFPAAFTPDSHQIDTRFIASNPAFLPFPPHSHQIHRQHSCLSRCIHTRFTASIPAFPAAFTPDSPPAFLPFPPHSHQIHRQHSCLSRLIHTRFTTRFTTSSAFPTGTVS